MGEEGRQCVFCFDVAGKQGGTMAGVQSTRVSSQARVPASRVNQVTLAQGADLLYRHPTSSRGETCKSLERSCPIASNTGSTPEQELSKSRERTQTAPHLAERNGKSVHYHP